MQQQTVPVKLVALTRRPYKVKRIASDPNVDSMIMRDIAALKRRDYGVGKRIHNTYGLFDREITDVSVDVRSGFRGDAYNTLLKAWEARQSLMMAG